MMMTMIRRWMMFSWYHRFIFLLSLTLSGIYNPALGQQQQQLDRKCNGVSNLCNLPVNQVMYAMVHNAMSSPSAGFVFFANHLQDPIVDSLDAGYTALNLDLCNCNGELQFCHGGKEVGCGVGRRDAIDTLNQISNWIISNPNNVIMISLQINEEAGGPITLADVDSLLQQVPNGFRNRLYNRNKLTQVVGSWPTLQELIDREQQVLFFYTDGPDGKVVNPPPGILYFHDYAYETDYSYGSVDELQERTLSSCQISRGVTSTGEFFQLNDFVTKSNLFGSGVQPSQDAAGEINTIEFASQLVDACSNIHYGLTPNIIQVDFWENGNLPDFVLQYNSALVGHVPTTTMTVEQRTPSPTIRTILWPPRTVTTSPTLYPSSKLSEPDIEALAFINVTNETIAITTVTQTLLPTSLFSNQTTTTTETNLSSSDSAFATDAPNKLSNDSATEFSSPTITPSILRTISPTSSKIVSWGDEPPSPSPILETPPNLGENLLPAASSTINNALNAADSASHGKLLLISILILVGLLLVLLVAVAIRGWRSRQTTRYTKTFENECTTSKASELTLT